MLGIITLESLYRIGFIQELQANYMIKQLMCFLGKKWLTNRNTSDKKESGQTHYEPLIINDDWVSFGYVRYGESIEDLQ